MSNKNFIFDTDQARINSVPSNHYLLPRLHLFNLLFFSLSSSPFLFSLLCLFYLLQLCSLLLCYLLFFLPVLVFSFSNSLSHFSFFFFFYFTTCYVTPFCTLSSFLLSSTLLPFSPTLLSFLFSSFSSFFSLLFHPSLHRLLFLHLLLLLLSSLHFSFVLSSVLFFFRFLPTSYPLPLFPFFFFYFTYFFFFFYFTANFCTPSLLSTLPLFIFLREN
jgi:hypothetical protein